MALVRCNSALEWSCMVSQQGFEPLETVNLRVDGLHNCVEAWRELRA
jgi:hypothetical protein